MGRRGRRNSIASHALKKEKAIFARAFNLNVGMGMAYLRKNPLPNDRRLDGSPFPKKRGDQNAVQQ